MGKLDLFNVVLTTPDGGCRAGQKLTGYVLVTVNANMKMKGVFISFKGRGRVKFQRGDDDTCKAEEDYFDDQHALFVTTELQNYLPLGEHRFDFRYQLASNLPSTFEGEYGYVRYYVKCRIKKQWKFDHVIKEDFTVRSELDLNLSLENGHPIHLEDHAISYECCCCCEEGEMRMKVDLPRTGYISGESIPVSVSLHSAINNTFNLGVRFIQKITYHASGYTKKEKREIAELLTVNGVGNHRPTLVNQFLLTPLLPPSGLVHCGIIDIEYFLKVKAIAGSVVLSCKALVIIGTVQLHSVNDAYSLAQSRTQHGVQPAEPRDPPLSSFTEPYSRSQGFGTIYSARPSCAESSFGNVGLQYRNDDKYMMGSTV